MKVFNAMRKDDAYLIVLENLSITDDSSLIAVCFLEVK
jgi:hypothetical protein